jgi:hypothetical protein
VTDTNFQEHPTSGFLRTSPGALKWPITPIRAQRTPINRLSKPKKPTGTPPVTQRTPPVTTPEQHRSQIVTGQVTEVIGCTPVRIEA